MSNFPSDGKEKRKNIYIRDPEVWAAFEWAVKNGALKARGVSERIEQLVAADLRKILPRLRKARVPIPAQLLPKPWQRGG